MNGKELLQQRGEFVATGIIKNIAGETNKVYNSGWVGSNVTISLNIDGRTQKIKVFGGVGKSEFPVKVFLKDAEGKVLRDETGKTITQQIPADSYDPNTFLTFDAREVFEWGEKDVNGKNTKIVHIHELTDGRFANRLLENKDMLLGRRVMIKGTVSFKPTQNFDKVQAEMSPTQITLLQPAEEGKQVVDKFVINSPVVVNKEAIGETVNGVLPILVPVYHKYLTPQVREGRQVKGRNVYVPITVMVKEKGFMNIDETYGFSIEDRTTILLNKINVVADDANMIAMRVCLSNKSGIVEREINIEDLLNDQVYGASARKAVAEDKVENFLKMYRQINPYTVRGEYKQEIDFISPLQINVKKEDGTSDYRDAICGIDPQMIEVMSLDKIQQETEAMKNGAQKPATQTQSKPQEKVPTINTPKKMDIPTPPISVEDVEDMDEFPF